MAQKIQFKRGTSATFYTLNPVLLKGEPGLETDTNKIKFGNGVSAWRDLPYANPNVDFVDGGELLAPAVPAVPGIFTPPTLSGLVLWLDANDPDYTHKVNNRLSMWEDLSETRAQFFQSNKLNRPSMANQISEKDVVTFDGVNDGMLGNFALPAEFTLLVALKRRGTSTHGRVIAAYNANNSNELVLCGTATGSEFGVRSGGGAYSATQPVDDLVPVIYTLQFTAAGFSTRLNGLNTQAGAALTIGALSHFSIGALRTDLATGNYGGDIAEVVLYNRVLTAPELLDAETYMLERWGIVQASHTLLEGMTAFWPLNEESGNRIDITDAEVPLTPTGTVEFEPGVIGNAAKFTGGANYLAAPTSFTLAGAFSVSLWFKSAAVTGSVSQIIQNWAGGMQGQMVLGFGDEATEAGVVWAYVRTADDNYRVSAPDIDANRWHHVALVFDQTNNKLLLYVDGVLADQVITAGALMTTSIPLRVGVGEQTSTPNTVAFLADQLGIWDRVLSATDIQMLYNDELGKEDFTADLYGDNVSLLLHMDKPANAVGGAGGGNADPYFNDVALLLHMNGPGFTDSSSNDLSVTPTNAVISSAQSKFGGSSAYFDGAAELTVAQDPDLNFGTGDFTVEAWVYLTSTPGDGFVASPVNDGGWFFGFWVGGGSGLGFGRKNIAWDISDTAPPTLNTWLHVVACRANGMLRLFVDGAQVQEASNSFDYNTASGDLFVGSHGASLYFNGYIDDLRITKGVARYTANFTPPTAEFPDNSAPTDPYFNDVSLLLNLNGPSITDSSPNAHQITNDGATISTAQSKFGGASAYFDGNSALEVPYSAQFSAVGSALTIEFWLNPDSVPAIPGSGVNAGGGLVSTRNSAVYSGYELSITPARYLRFLGYSGGTWGAGGQIFGTTALAANQWQHVALVIGNNGDTRVYVNGVADTGFATLNIAYSENNGDTTVYVGAGGDGSYVGYIDDLRITKGVARYTANFTPPTAEFPLGPITTVTMPTVETALLLHFDGASFVDSGSNGLTVTANGATLSTTESKFGGASGYFDGAADLQFTPSVETQFGADDFTVEFWLYITDEPQNNQVIISFCNWPNTSGIVFGYTDTLFSAYTGGFTAALSVSRPVNNTWHHYAAVRINGQLSLFIDGVKQTPTNQTGTFSGNFTDGLQFIGRPSDANSYQLHGYIDELRITKGAGLYGANFTPPTAPFANPQPTPDLLVTFDAGIEDLSANAHTITNNNNVGTASSTGFGNAGTFNGTNSHLVIPDAPEFDLSSGSFCIELRFYASALEPDIETASSCLISKDQWGVSFSWGIFIAANGVSVPTANIAGDWSFLVTQTITSNAWHHIAVTGDGTTMKLFYDGALVGTKNRTLTNAAADVTIGCSSYNNPSSFFTGDIDNVRIVKGRQVYTANFTPPTGSIPAPVITPAPDLLLHFDGSDGSTTFTDHGKNQLPTVVNGNAAISTIQRKFGGASGYFDGTGDFLKFESGPWGGWNDSDWTIEFWIWPVSVTGYAPLFLCAESLNLHLYNTGDLYLNDAVTGTGGLTVSEALVTEQWQHVALVRRGGISYLHVNGVIQGSASVPYGSGPGTTLAIGGENTQSAYFNGYIDELRVVKGHALYTANFTPPVAPFQNPIITITQPATDPTATLLLHFDGANGSTTFTDSSPSVLTVTANGSAAISTAQSKFGGAGGYFDGTGDYLEVAGLSLDLDDFTVECWVRLDEIKECAIFNQGDSDSAGCFCLAVNSNNSTVYLYADNDVRLNNSTATLSIGTWSHVALVRQGEEYKLFIDGILEGSYTGTHNHSGLPFKIAHGYGGIEHLNGYIDELRVVKGFALYTANFTPPTAPFGSGSDGGGAGPITTFIDSSKHNHALTAVGNAYLNLEDIKYGSGSGEFAGGHCTIPMSPEFALGDGDFTVEFWGNLNYAANSAVFSIAPESEEAGTYLIGFRNDPNMFGFCYDMPNFTFVSADISAYYAEWAHYAFVRLDGVLKMYVNGAQVGTANTTIDFDGGTQTTAVIGRRWVDVDDYYLDGLIDDLRITKGVARYIANFNPPPKAFPDPVLVTPPAPIGDIYAENVTLLLHMDGANGSTTFTDNSYLQNTVTAEGGAVVSTAQSKFGGASLDVTQVGRKLLVDSAPAASLGSGDFTIECWLYWTGSISGDYSWGAIAATATAPNPGGWYFLLDTNTNDGVANALMWIDENSGFIPGNMSVPANEWCHVAVVRSGNNIRLYINGIAAGSGTSNTDIVHAGPVAIGADNGEAGYVLGYIDDFRITKGVARYTGTFLPPTAAFLNPFSAGGTLVAGIRAFWSFNETSGTRRDSFYGLPATEASGAVASVPGVAGNAISIVTGNTSGSSYIKLPAGICNIGTGQKTFSVWFKLVQNNIGYQWIWMQGQNVDYTECNPCYVENDNSLHCIFSTSDGTWTNVMQYNGANTITTNVWHHAVAVFEGAACTLYYDGQQTMTQQYYGSITFSNAEYTLGRYNPFVDNIGNFTGEIDGVGIWDRALTAAEVAQLYNNGAGLEIGLLTPADITGCDLWLDSTGEIAESNGAILTWADKSGNGRTATPADYAPAPIVAAGDGPNGQDVVRFSGDPNVLDISYQFNLKNSSGFVLAQHAADITNGPYGRFLSFQPANGLDHDQPDGLAFSTNQGNPTGIGLYNNNIGATHAMTLPLGWTLLVYTIDANGVAKLRVDGEEVDNTAFTGIAPTAGGNLYIGHGGSSGLIEALQGDIAEIALFDHALGEAALIGLEQRIMTRWFPPPAAPETILLLHFDGPVGTPTFVDASPLSQVISSEMGAIITDTQAKFNQSVYFNGSPHRVYTNASPTLDISGGAYTIEFWAYVESELPGDGARLFTFEGQNNGNRSGLLLYRNAGQTTYSLSMNRYGIPVGFSADNVLTEDQWAHIALTYDGTVGKLYVNGVDTNAVATHPDWSEQLFPTDSYSVSIGANTAPFSQYVFNGYIDEFRVVKGAAVYAGNFTPPTQPFGAANLLLHFDADTADNSGNNVSVTNSGVTIDTATTKFGAGSAYFNGNNVATLTTPDLPAFGFGTGDFTIEMFVNQQSGTRNSVISVGTYQNGILWRLLVAAPDTLYLAANDPAGIAGSNWLSTASIPLDTWTHIALTRQSGTVCGFVGGVKVFEQTGVTADLGASRPLTIGCGAHELSPTDAYYGFIDELRIIKGEAVYTGNFTPPTAPFN